MVGLRRAPAREKIGEKPAMEEIARIGCAISVGGSFFPMGGCVNPAFICEARLRAAGAGIRRCFIWQALQIRQPPDGWMVSPRKLRAPASAARARARAGQRP